MSTIVKEFIKRLGKNDIHAFQGPFSPLMCGIPWARKGEFPILFVNRGRHSFWAVDEHKYFDFARKMFMRYVRKEVSIEELRNTYRLVETKASALYAQVIHHDLKCASDENLATWVGKSGELFTDLIDASIYIETFDESIALSVLGDDRKAFLDVMWGKATHPAFPSFETRHLAHTLSEIAPIGGGRISKEAIRELLYIYTDYFRSLTEEEAEMFLSKILKEKEKRNEELKKREHDLKENMAEYVAWFDSLGEEEKYIAAYIQFVMELRDIRKDSIAKLQTIIGEIANEMLTRAGIPIDNAYALTPAECGKGVEYLKNAKDEILKRREGFAGLLDSSGAHGTEIGDFDSLLKECNDLLVKRKINQKTFNGQVANKGRVTGVVRVVLDSHNDKGFEKGDILVTSMTRPEFVPLMKMSAAVITNEGGITCHAAIISRELKKPCIIGTKIATQVLKDGDLVEVDADHGVVRILERS